MGDFAANESWIVSLTDQIPRDVDPATTSPVDEIIRFASGALTLRFKVEKLEELQMDITRRYMEMEPIAQRIVDLHKEQEILEEQLRFMGAGLLSLEQQYILGTYTFNHQLQTLGGTMTNAAADIYEIQNSRFLRDIFQQVVNVLETRASKKLPFLEDAGSNDVLYSKQTIVRELQAVLSSKLIGKSVPVTVAGGSNHQLLQPPAVRNPNPFITTTAATTASMDLSSHTTTTKLNPAIHAPQLSIDTARRTDDGDFFDTGNDQPIEASTIHFAASFHASLQRPEPIAQEFVNNDSTYGKYANLHYTVGLLPPTSATQLLPTSVKVMNEATYMTYADKFQWIKTDQPNTFTITTAGLFNRFKTSTLLKNNMIPHSFLLVEHQCVPNANINNISTAGPMFDQYIRFNSQYLYNAESRVFPLGQSLDVNTTNSMDVPSSAPSSSSSGVSDIQRFIPTPNIDHDQRFQYFQNILNLQYYCTVILQVLEGLPAHDVFCRYTSAFPLWEVQSGECFFNSSGGWLSVAIDQEILAQNSFARQFKYNRLVFKTTHILRYLALWSRLTKTPISVQLHGMATDVTSPDLNLTQTREEEHLMTHFPLNQTVMGIVANIVRESGFIISSFVYTYETIEFIENPHCFVLQGFESIHSYTRYQNSYINTLHFYNQTRASVWLHMLGAINTFDPSGIDIQLLFDRTAVIKSSTTPLSATIPLLPKAATLPKTPLSIPVPLTPNTPGISIPGSPTQEPIPLPPQPPAIPKKRGPGRPRKNETAVAGGHGINRQNYQQIRANLAASDTMANDQDTATNQATKALLKRIRKELNGITKQMCSLPFFQHSYLHMRIPRTNVRDAPMPLTVPPYVLLSEDARTHVRQKFAIEMWQKSVTYATDLANVAIPDTFLGINGCSDDFVSKLESTGKINEADLAKAKCIHCGKYVRCRTGIEGMNRKKENATPCFAYTPCKCKKLLRCVRCHITYWLWHYNNHCHTKRITSDSDAKLAFEVPCLECGVPWRISQLILVSFDHLCDISNLRETFFSGEKGTGTKPATATPPPPPHSSSSSSSRSSLADSQNPFASIKVSYLPRQQQSNTPTKPVPLVSIDSRTLLASSGPYDAMVIDPCHTPTDEISATSMTLDETYVDADTPNYLGDT